MKLKQRTDSRMILFAAVSYVAIIAYALLRTMIGPSAVVMMDYFGTNTAQQGVVLTVQALGELSVAVVLVFFGERFNMLRLVAVGLAVMALGGFAVGLIPHMGAANPYYLMLLFILISGFGFNLINTMVNSSIMVVLTSGAKTAMPLLHFFYSTGAMATPLLVNLLVDETRPATFAVPYTLFACVAVLACVAYLIVKRTLNPISPAAAFKYNRATAPKEKADPLFVLRTKKAWLLFVVSLGFHTYATAVEYWISSYLVLEAGFSFDQGSLILSVFFFASLLMRLFVVFILRRVTVKQYITVAGILAAAAMAVALLSRNYNVIMLFVGLSGFAAGGLGPCIYMLPSLTFPQHTASATSFIMLCSGLIGLLFPLVMGGLSGIIGMAPTFFGMLAILVASSLLLWMFDKKGRL